jgi:hypothetical protein
MIISPYFELAERPKTRAWRMGLGVDLINSRSFARMARRTIASSRFCMPFSDSVRFVVEEFSWHGR